MSYFNIVAQSSESTVVTEYKPQEKRSDAYQSEAELEKEFIRLLVELGYEHLTIHKEKDLITNLRLQLEKLNNYTFSDSEWERFFTEVLANAKDGIVEKTRLIQEDHVQVLKRDDGTSKNILLIDKKSIHNNRLQVINQYAVSEQDGANHDNRYDVTVLVNGLPLIHIELKRRGVPIREAFNQINRYQRDSFWAASGLYEFVQVFVISNGTNTKYYSNTTRFNHIKEANSSEVKKAKTSNSFEFTSFWADANNRIIPDLVDFTKTFFAKHAILNILTRYCVFTAEEMLLVTLNTLWVDKNLKMHGLIQAYSRTNRILNSIKTFGNIVCFRNLQKRTDDAISLFGDKEAGGIVLMRGYKDYYYGYEDDAGKYHPGYVNMIEDLTTKYPLTDERITGEKNQKEFIALFGAILRMRNILSSFDDFVGNEILTECDFQDYLGRYQDLYDEWKNRKPGGDKEDITDDIVFEIELIKQIEINIDYILILVKKYHDSHCDDKEVLVTIQKAIDSSPELRSKKALIENFIAGINDVSDVMIEWRQYVAEEKEKQLVAIITEENLKEEETRKFIDTAFRDGSVKTSGTDIDKLMPPMTRFGGGNRAEKKKTIIDKLVTFFDRFFSIG